MVLIVGSNESNLVLKISRTYAIVTFQAILSYQLISANSLPWHHLQVLGYHSTYHYHLHVLILLLLSGDKDVSKVNTRDRFVFILYSVLSSSSIYLTTAGMTQKGTSYDRTNFSQFLWCALSHYFGRFVVNLDNVAA